MVFDIRDLGAKFHSGAGRGALLQGWYISEATYRKRTVECIAEERIGNRKKL